MTMYVLTIVKVLHLESSKLSKIEHFLKTLTIPKNFNQLCVTIFIAELTFF